jgi:hypothetical protein
VRGAAERDKPNRQRFREFTDARCRASNSSSAPRAHLHRTREIRLGYSLARMREWLGPDHPVVRKLLSTESPSALAKRLVAETKLADPAVRLELWKGGSAAIAASTDPMIVLARSVMRMRARSASVRRWSRSAVALRDRAHCQGAVRQARHHRVSGCHVHAAPQLRHRAGLE